MSALFEKDTDTVGLHLKNIYIEQELDEHSSTEKNSVVQNRLVEMTSIIVSIRN